MKIRELLEEEVKISNEFTKVNFGTMYGEKYGEMVRDLLESKNICALLLVDLAIAGITGPEVARGLKDAHDKPEEMQKAILNNIHTFAGPLSMLYWGIEIGKKLAKQEKEISTLEKMFGEDQN